MTSPAKRIPIAAVKAVAEAHGQIQVIMVTTDGSTTHVITYGKTLWDCRLAADAGNNLKRFLGWPESLCQDKPARARRQDRDLVQVAQDAAAEAVKLRELLMQARGMVTCTELEWHRGARAALGQPEGEGT